MTLNSVSMRRWMLWSAVPCGILYGMHFGLSCACYSLWLLTGFLFSTEQTPYTRKTGPLREGARAFLVLWMHLLLFALFYRLGSVLYHERTWQRYCYETVVPCTVQGLLQSTWRIRTSPKVAVISALILVAFFVSLIV